MIISSLLAAEGLAQLGCSLGAGIATIGAGLGIGKNRWQCNGCYCPSA